MIHGLIILMAREEVSPKQLRGKVAKTPTSTSAAGKEQNARDLPQGEGGEGERE